MRHEHSARANEEKYHIIFYRDGYEPVEPRNAQTYGLNLVLDLTSAFEESFFLGPNALG